jgi:hypothetical protein
VVTNLSVGYPSVFGGNISTAEFGMMSAETACWDIPYRKKIAKFTSRSTFLYGSSYWLHQQLVTIHGTHPLTLLPQSQSPYRYAVSAKINFSQLIECYRGQ